MKNEKESIELDVNENTNEHQHVSFWKKVVDKVTDIIENMDTDFPLSGGEEHPVHHKHHYNG